MRRVRLLVPFLLVVVAVLSSGCANYWHNRGKDASQIFDIGITVTPHLKPDFQAYIGFLGSIPIGVAYMDHATLLGAGNNQAGCLDYENKSYGLVLWGSAKQGCGEFDSKDPYQARSDQASLTERPRFNTGPVRILAQGDGPPPLGFVECDKGLHIGYVGILLNCRLLEIFDFLAGWTTLDFMGDDDHDSSGAK